MNKRTTKEQAKCKRRYESGILMYRERKNTFVVPAGTNVQVVKHGPKQTLCRLPKQMNNWLTMIDNENLPAFRNTGAKQTKGRKTAAPVVAQEAQATEQAI